MSDFFIVISFFVFLYGVLKGLKWLLKKVDKTEKMPHLKRSALYAIGGICVYIVLAFIYPKEKVITTPASPVTPPVANIVKVEPIKLQVDELKARRDAFITWKKNYDATMALFDMAWINWRGTMDRLSKGSIGQQTAWQNMKTLNSDLMVVKSLFYDMKAPDILENDAKTLNKATSDISDTCSSRARAAKMMMDMLDNGSFKPSKVDEVMSEIQTGDIYLVDAVKKVAVIERLLGAQTKKIATK